MANANTPIGWQNLASERQRIRGRDTVLAEIHKIYPDAEEIEVGDDYAYATGPDRLLVGIAWKAEQSDVMWWYVVMSDTVFAAGMRCVIMPDEDDRTRIIPSAMGGQGIFAPIEDEAEEKAEAMGDEGALRTAFGITRLKPFLYLSTRSTNCLRNAGIDDLETLLDKTEDDLLSIEYFGKKSLREIKAILSGMGLSLKAAAAPFSFAPSPGALHTEVSLGRRPSRLLKKTISMRGGKLIVWVETRDKARELGPFDTRQEANKAANRWAESL